MVKNSLDTSIINIRPPQQPAAHEGSENSFMGNFVNKQQNW
jgi:hypothetical protein